MNKRIPVSVAVAFALMIGGLATSEALKPRVHLADVKPKLVLTDLVPTRFGDWRELPSVKPIVPDPTVQAMLDSLYTQTLARAYINKKGQVIMLSIAYGSDQNSEATAAHRPEFCYQGSGLAISTLGTRRIGVGSHDVEVRQLTGIKDTYQENISYWVTLDEHTTLPGLGRKLAQLRYGLRGEIADGMLVRISSVGHDAAEAVELQDRFVRDLFQQVPQGFQARIFGA